MLLQSPKMYSVQFSYIWLAKKHYAYSIPLLSPTKKKTKRQKFDAHCNPKKNITYERYIFNTCTQNGRPFDTFLIDVMKKAKSCDFLTLYDELIRDRIVCGIDSTQTRERLLRNTELTLEKAVTFCRAVETSRTQVSEWK